MLRFYYTIISEENTPQTRPDLSLGGFRSSTLVPNNSLGNLFSDISCYSVRENQNEYVAIIMVNETGADVTDVIFYFDYPENRQKDLELAFVDLNSNNEMEIIPNPYSQPFTAVFNSADGVGNALNIGDISANGTKGIWVKRILNLDNINVAYSDDNLDENGNPQEADEDIVLVVSWT